MRCPCSAPMGRRSSGEAGIKQGLRVLLREGRRCGYDSLQVAGVTFFSSATGARLEGKPKLRGTGRKLNKAEGIDTSKMILLALLVPG